MAEEFTAKFKVDISDLKKNITEANKEIKLANATFKNETAGMENWTKNADGLGSKLKQLDSVLKNQKSVLESYKGQLEASKKAYEENGSRAEQLKAKLQELTNNGVSKSSEEYKKYNDALKNVIGEQSKNEKSVEDLTLKILDEETQVKNTEAQIGKYSDALEDLQDEQRKAADEAEKQKSAYEELEDTISDQQQQLDALKDEYSNVVIEQGKNSESAKDLAKQIDDLSGELADNKQKLKDADKAADDLDNTLDDTKGSTENASGGFSVMKGALADLASKGIQLCIEKLKDLATAAYDAWKAFDEGADRITAMTGATGEQAEDLSNAYETVSRRFVGDFNDIGGAIGEVNTRFGLAGDELADVSEAFLKFSQLNGTDVVSSVDSVQAAMAAWGVDTKNVVDVLDLLNSAGQASGTSVSTLSDQLLTNGLAFQEMGFSISDATMFLANLEKNGVDSSAVMTGLKKAMQEATKTGKPLSQVMDDFTLSMKYASDDTKAAQVATELFGAKAGPAIAAAVRDGRISFKQFGSDLEDFSGNVEDTFEATLDAPDRLALAVQNLKVEAATAINEFMTENEPQIQEFLDRLIQEGLPVLQTLLNGIMNVLSWIADHIDVLSTFLTILGTAVAIYEAVTAAQTLLNIAMNANPVMLIVTAIGLLIGALVALWNNSEDFRNFWIGLWDGIKEVVSAVAEWFSQAWEDIVNWFRQAWEDVKNFFSDIWNGIKEIVLTIVNWYIDQWKKVFKFFKDLWDNIKKIVKAAWEAIEKIWKVVADWFKEKVIDPIVEFFQNLKEKITGFFDKLWEDIKAVWRTVSDWFNNNVIQPVVNFFSGLYESVTSIFTNIWNTIVGIFEGAAQWFYDNVIAPIANFFSGLWNTISGIFSGASSKKDDLIAEANAASSGADSSGNSIPQMASGGILRKGEIGLLEGNGAEAVVPLENNKRWIAAVARDMKAAISVNGASGTLGGVVSGGSQMNFTQNNYSPKALSRIEIYRNTQNLLKLAEMAGVK